MSSPLLHSLHDPEIQSLKSARAKAKDDERKSRFFDSKQRQIGLDIDALNKQVFEKKLEKLAELENERKYNIFNELLVKEEKEMKISENIERRRLEEKLNEYRFLNQRKEQRREFDLNDPQYLCKSLPMCTGDNDPRIKSKGSLLRFDGEDYDGVKEKKKLVKLKHILEEQIEENKQLKTSIKMADKEWVNDWILDNQLYRQCIEIEEKAKKDEIQHITTYNNLLSLANRIKEKNENKKNESETLSHMYNYMTSDFFTDASNTASALGKTRINPNYYKGLSAEELREIKRVQLMQIDEKKKMEEAENFLDTYYNTLQHVNCQEELKIKEEIKNDTSCKLQKIRDYNKALALEQRIRREEMDRQARDNIPSEEFYSQFNKTSK